MKKLRGVIALLLWMSLTAAIASSMVTEVVPLGFRNVEEIIPVVRPLVPAPGTVTGTQSQLVIRTTPDNLREIKAVLAKLDRPPRRLLISVKNERQGNLQSGGVEATGSYRAGDVTISTGRPYTGGSGLNINTQDVRGLNAGVGLYQDRSRESDTGVHQVQTLEGREAYIGTGTSLPVGERTIYAGPGGAEVHDAVRYRDLTSGFYVLPRLNGNTVTLDISSRSMRKTSAGAGIVDVQEANTVVSGKLGEWIPVGGAIVQAGSSRTGTVYTTRRTVESRGAILLKVDELP